MNYGRMGKEVVSVKKKKTAPFIKIKQGKRGCPGILSH
jgi:hypothetical protein